MLIESPTGGDLFVDAAQFAKRTGWELKPEGACKGAVCVPMPDEVRSGEQLDASILAERLGMPLVRDDAAGMVAMGPESLTGTALTSVEAPELTLQDMVTGESFSLSSLRGTKVAIVSWAPW
ncbi:MAG: hypothetical protein ACI8Y4_004095 [Candidatus Poriferisodalaceae bacterium]|jgi:hypothetical protein